MQLEVVALLLWHNRQACIAFAAMSAEGHLTVLNYILTRVTHPARYVGKIRVYIKNSPACIACEVVVFVTIVVVMGCAMKIPDVYDIPGTCHLVQVPVHRRLADGRVPTGNIFINLVCCRMCVKVPYGMKNNLPLNRVSFAIHIPMRNSDLTSLETLCHALLHLCTFREPCHESHRG